MKPLALKIKLGKLDLEHIFCKKKSNVYKSRPIQKIVSREGKKKKMLSCPYFVYVEKTTKRLKNFAIFWLADTRN